MEPERVVKEYDFKGIQVGELVESLTTRARYFRTLLSSIEAIDLVLEMSPEQRVHMKHSAYGVYRLLQHHELNPDDYVSDEDIMITAANKGLTNLTQLNRGDHRAWELTKQRSLEKELFGDFEA